jgi:hypothetical protein
MLGAMVEEMPASAAHRFPLKRQARSEAIVVA